MTDALAVVAAQLEAAVGDRLEREAPIGPRTTYRVGGAAALLLEAASDDDLVAARDALSHARATGGADVPVLVVGNGSNLLVADSGFPGLAVVLGEAFTAVEIDGTTVRAGGAALLPVVARRTAAAGLTGFEWAVGVPGSIGGAVRMNAGGHGSDMAATVRRVRVVDFGGGHDGWVPAADLDLAYRSSSVGAATVVVEAELALATGDAAAAEAEIAEIVRWRRANQPGGQNAGSVFTNPAGDSAGRLIDAAGGKGRRVGSAQVSTKHANFIIADAGGRADDVVALMVEVRDLVAATQGVVLEPETRLCGYVLPPPRHPRVEVEG